MRITLLSHFPGRGGSTGFVDQLREFFVGRGHHVSVVVGDDAPDAMVKDYGVVPRWPKQTWRERMREYVRIVEGTRPDVVYTICGREEFDVLRFLRLPRVLHCLCIERHDYADLPLWLRHLEPHTELRTTHAPDLLSRVRGHPRHEIQLAYIPWRIPEIFVNAPDVATSTKANAGHRLEVCFLGRLEKYQKRADWLPEIMQRCERSGALLRWHIYGSGPAEDELRDRVAKGAVSHLVEFHGWQEPEALAKRLSQHDLFFLCSRWEGLPAAMAEGMLCGLACVVPNFPAGMTYLVSTGGGWAYEARTPRHCAEALIKAVSDRTELQRRRQEAQQFARSLYARKVVDERFAHLETLLQQLRFNGNVDSIDTAARMRTVTLPAFLKRKCLELVGRLPAN